MKLSAQLILTLAVVAGVLWIFSQAGAIANSPVPFATILAASLVVLPLWLAYRIARIIWTF